MAGDRSELSSLLAQANTGDPQALAKLVARVYPELRRLAGHYMRRERNNHTLQPTALINEAYLKLAQDPAGNWQDRTHFMAVAARVMRSLLIDYARGHAAGKRGGGFVPLELKEAVVYAPEKATALLELEDALERLERADPVKARVVELKFYGGLSIDEIASVMAISETTVKRYWAAAHARLKRDLAKARSQ